MSAARASGTDLASSLNLNTFLTLRVHPAGGPGSARDGGTEGAPGREDRGGPGTGGHGGPRDGGTRWAPGRGDMMGPGTGGRGGPAKMTCHPMSRLP